MKSHKNRFPVKRLFVLGAGASFGASQTYSDAKHKETPLDSHFCESLMNLDVQRPAWVKEAKGFIYDHWKDHLSMDHYGLEEAIMRQMAHLEFIDGIHPHRRRGAVRESEYMNHVSHLICFVLRRARERGSRPYEKLAKTVFPHELDIEAQGDRVVTFNYDELLDKHLVNRFETSRVYFDRIKERQSDSARRRHSHPHPLLVKLHGSVNWRCSQSEFSKIVASSNANAGTHWIESVWYSRQGTPSPSEDSSPLILPPLPTKPITRIELFRFLWTKAYEYLHEAEELVICGYSLPEADQLAQSLFSGFANRKLKQITIVDPNPAIISRWRALLRRKNVNEGARWMYHDDFDEYVAELEAGAT